MKRLMLVAIAAALMLSVSIPARAASVWVSRFVNGSYSDGNGNYVNLTAYTAEDLTGNNPPAAYAYVTMTTPSGSDSGQGALALTLDPSVTIGSISGTVAGSGGPITVDLTFIGVSFNSAQPPTVYAQLSPTAPSGYAGYGHSKAGSVDGTVNSAVGTITVTGGYASASYGLNAVV